jgi:hypothetical protein
VELYSTSKTGITYKREINSTYFKSVYQIYDIQKDYESGTSLFYMAKKYNIDKYEIRRKAKIYKWSRLEKELSHADVVGFITYVQSKTSQGFASAIKTDKSIMDYLDQNTCLSDSISKRCFDLVFPEAEKKCRSCNEPLRFATYECGYGAYKGRKICGKCINSKYSGRSCVSKVSQDLFWSIYNIIDTTLPVWFAELNREKTISTESFQQLYPNINKHYYALDFLYNNTHNIEYDGAPWHDNTKDIARDHFLKNEKNIKILRIPHAKFIKNKTDVIEECLQFLTY